MNLTTPKILHDVVVAEQIHPAGGLEMADLLRLRPLAERGRFDTEGLGGLSEIHDLQTADLHHAGDSPPPVTGGSS